jgi:cobalt-zinc-cadmium efflux system outer membrane protein
MIRSAALRWAAFVAAALFTHPAASRAQAPTPYPLGGDLPAHAAPPHGAAPAGAPTDEPTGTLELRRALAAALLRNPDLAAESLELRAREAALLQAGSFPNPTLSIEVEDFAGTGEFGGTDEAQTTFQLGQLIELGGKRAARLGVAVAERDIAAWDYEIRRVDVFARTAGAFVNVLAAQERLELTEEALELAHEVKRVATRRRAAGLASPAEEIRAGVAADVAGVEREHAEHELLTARQGLAALWAGEQARFERAEGDLEALPGLLPAEDIDARLDASPAVVRWQAELSRREALHARAQSQRFPDLMLAGGPRRLSGADETAFVVGASLPLPLWNRGGAAVVETEQRLAKLRAEQRAARVRTAADLTTARVALEASVEEAQLLRDRVLPGIERSIAVIRRGYEQGRFAQIEILEAQRGRVAAREQYLRALVEAHQSAREIERLTGVPLEDRR